MVLLPPGSRPGTPRSLGNHEARIRALERRAGRGGDYVFLREIALDADTSQIQFADITQAYRHLVFEGSLAAIGGGPDEPPIDLLISIDQEYTFAPQHVYYSDDDPTAVVGTGAGDNEDEAQLLSLLPFADGNYDGDPWFMGLTLKFVYYTENERSKTGVWQAVSYADRASQYSTGGIIAEPGGTDAGRGPITQVTFFTGGPLLAAGSKVSMYGIR